MQHAMLFGNINRRTHLVLLSMFLVQATVDVHNRDVSDAVSIFFLLLVALITVYRLLCLFVLFCFIVFSI